jgi:hypothetical protein
VPLVITARATAAIHDARGSNVTRRPTLSPSYAPPGTSRSQLIGATAGLVPVGVYEVGHYELTSWSPLECPKAVIVYAGLLFSALTVLGWSANMFGSKAKALGFTLLLEGIETGEIENVWSYTLSWSRGRSFAADDSQRQTTILRRPHDSFTEFGGVLHESVIDTMPGVVDGWECNQPILNIRFVDFAAYYRFAVHRRCRSGLDPIAAVDRIQSGCRGPWIRIRLDP